jgi:hypothetical protein
MNTYFFKENFMNPCKGFFQITPLTPDIEAFSTFLLYCKDFVKNNLHHFTEENEPHNEPITQPISTPKKSRSFALPSALSSCISHGLKLLGLSTFANTVSAQNNTVVAGVPPPYTKKPKTACRITSIANPLNLINYRLHLSPLPLRYSLLPAAAAEP